MLAKTEADQAQADVIDAEAVADLDALHVRRIGDEQVSKHDREQCRPVR